MENRKLIIVLLLVYSNILLFGQCEYILNDYSHNDCHGTNYGSIDITISHPGASCTWTGPNGFTDNTGSTSLSNLYAGTY